MQHTKPKVKLPLSGGLSTIFCRLAATEKDSENSCLIHAHIPILQTPQHACNPNSWVEEWSRRQLPDFRCVICLEFLCYFFTFCKNQIYGLFWYLSWMFMKILFYGINTTEKPSEQNFLKRLWQVLRKSYIPWYFVFTKPQKIPDRWQKSGMCHRDLNRNHK